MNIESLLTRRVREVIVASSLRERLLSGKKLRVKFGIDPTAPDVHLGHAIPIMKLREFQRAGHKAVLIIGDFTAMIGDPSGKNSTRPALSAGEVKKNAKTYLAQIGKLIDLDRAEVHMNSKWLGKLTSTMMMNLLSKITVEQLMMHETFRKRREQHQGIAFHEILYPVMQGYDSVVARADVELGGLDQKFNLLMGRELQKDYGQTPQEIVMMDYLIGTDGHEKMSKSLENYIALTDTASDMYGQVMSIPDGLIIQYAGLATELDEDDIEQFKEELESGINPQKIKAAVARAVVALYHGRKAGESAEREFARVFKDKQLPTRVPETAIPKKRLTYIELLVTLELVSSNSDARRVIAQGGLSVNAKKISDPSAVYTPKADDIIKVGKKKFAKVKLKK